VFLAFFLFGNHLQMLILFGLEPILGIFGMGKYATQYEYEYMGELQHKLSEGKELSQKEAEAFQKMQQKQAMAQGGGHEAELNKRRLLYR
jgi:hypothetical protein